MKILLISYGDLDYDGRLRSLISLFNRIGDVYSYTRGSKSITEHGEVCDLPYGLFIKNSIVFAKKKTNIDVLVLDNRKATIPGLIIKKMINPRCVIQDCRELYLINEVKHFASKIGCIFEREMIKKADIVICANRERAKIMKHIYDLSEEPLVYENLRQLKYSSEDDIQLFKEKFKDYIKDDEIRIISTSGCSIDRTNDVLVKNLSYVENKCRLFLVGENNIEEKNIICRIASDNKKNCITILNQLKQGELKYLISKCDIGIVNYGQYDINNKYCASGKLYEYLYEGIPVVTTSNPPLKNICRKYKVGIFDDTYYMAINSIITDYCEYKANVIKYTKKKTIETNDNIFIEEISKKITTYSKE